MKLLLRLFGVLIIVLGVIWAWDIVQIYSRGSPLSPGGLTLNGALFGLSVFFIHLTLAAVLFGLAAILDHLRRIRSDLADLRKPLQPPTPGAPDRD